VDGQCLVFRKTPDAAQRGGQILPVHVLHREIQETVGFADVVHPADVRVGDLARRAHFVVELREAQGIAPQVLRQELQRAWLAEPQIVGAVDLSHPAASQQPDDPIAPVERCAGREASVIDRVRRGQPAVGCRRSAAQRRCAPPDP
jgi:hypothetical protein